MQGLCPPFQFSILSEGAWLLPAAASQNCDKGDARSPRRTRARGPSQPYICLAAPIADWAVGSKLAPRGESSERAEKPINDQNDLSTPPQSTASAAVQNCTRESTVLPLDLPPCRPAGARPCQKLLHPPAHQANSEGGRVAAGLGPRKGTSQPPPPPD